ncbi:MAG: hypothetical protein ABIL09_28595, partial [Gemmatimonadota bacterium]
MKGLHRVWAAALAALALAMGAAVAQPESETAAVSRPVVHLLKLHTVDTQGGMIDPGLTAFVERAVEDANAAGVGAIVFEIDTFGGRVDAATVIRDAILDAEPLTIAFINRRASRRAPSSPWPATRSSWSMA